MEIGGCPTQYNKNFSLEGFKALQKAKFSLEVI
jgi:hypothetical protein